MDRGLSYAAPGNTGASAGKFNPPQASAGPSLAAADLSVDVNPPLTLSTAPNLDTRHQPTIVPTSSEHPKIDAAQDSPDPTNQPLIKDRTSSVSEPLEESLEKMVIRIQGRTLEEYFPSGDAPRLYSDFDLQNISKLLKSGGRHSWSEVPRIYTVLRIIGELQAIELFLDQGITDIWFPFSFASLPKALGSTFQGNFLDAQRVVLTKGLDFEKDENREHAHFGRGDALPFKVENELGAGNYSQVHKITSLISMRAYARKQFRRGNGPRSEAEIKNFKTELQILKKIHHHHCVELVASYTDAKWFGLIMSPVADCNLKSFYDTVAGDETRLGILRTFYGCLIAALAYLHSMQIRHRDIKPQNILVKGERVFLADFGVSLDWQTGSGSTTTEDSAKTWLYCAPEVAQFMPRNSKSDIWSLGCVFLEMTTVLAGFSVNDMQLFFRKTNDDSRFYSNIGIIPDWVTVLRSKSGSEYDTPLKWVTEMLQFGLADRPSAQVLFNLISGPISQTETRFCGRCCEVDAGSDDADSDGYVWANEHNSRERSDTPEKSITVSLQKELPETQSAWGSSKNPSTKISTVAMQANKTRLHIACQKCQINLVEQLLSTHENIDAIDTHGRSPLHYATEAGHSEVVYLLLRNRANQGIEDNAGLIPEDLASDPVVIWLLKNGHDYNATDLKGDAFLHTIIRSPSATAAETVEWALNRGYNVDCRDAEDNTPLFCAVSQGIRDITQVLINHGAGIASQSMDGDPPLVLAARNGNYGIVKVLLDNGAPIEDPRSKRSAQALVEAAGRGHSRIVQLLLYRGAKVDQRSSDDWVALSHAAASVGNLDIVQQLVEAGADVNDTASQTDRHLPLAEACHWSHLHIIDYLLEKGADVELRGRMHPVMGGDTLLIAAARGSRFDVCERLLKYGADAEFPDSFGKSAINWAKEIGNERLVKLLQRFRK